MFADDLTPFFDAAGLGTAAVWSVGPTNVNGIFSSGYEAAQLGALAGVEGTRFTFQCATADVPTAAHGQTITIASVAYVIRGVQPDGTGVTLLILNKP